MNIPSLSIVVPVFNEELAIPILIERLHSLADRLFPLEIEIILVDDHSCDGSCEILRKLLNKDSRLRYARLSRNSGSHIAILAGLELAKGDCAVFLAADLQDPPELIPQLLDAWRAGSQIVWAVRDQRHGVSYFDLVLSNIFYRLMNLMSEVSLPPTGSDFALLDRKVIDALLKSSGSHPSIIGEIARLGFSQSEIKYAKEQRVAGKTKWTVGRKLKAFADAFVLFSYAPLRIMSYSGMVCSLLGFFYASFVVILRLRHSSPVPGWSSLMVVVLVLGGVQMMMLGVLGEYLWRTLEAARRRPAYFLEETTEPGAIEGPARDVQRRFGR